MSLILEPLTKEEIRAYIQVQWDAFEPLTANMIFPMVYPRGLQPDLIARFTARWLKTFEEDAKTRCYCARDASTRELVGISNWGIVTDAPKTKEEIDAKFKEFWEERKSLPAVEGTNEELSNVFGRAAFYTEQEIMMGQDYLSFNLLATSPKHQRKGVGSFLLKAALDEADRLGLPAFLHAGIMGRPLYEHFGFKVVKEMGPDCRDYGGQSDGKHWCMVRPARSSKAGDV